MNPSTFKIIVIKYGGNAMTDNNVRRRLIKNIAAINNQKDYKVVLIHGGGPFINQSLVDAGISSEFLEGHRITSPEAILEVEKTLKGKVNAQLVSDFLALNVKAVGLSGKDGAMVMTIPRKAKDKTGNIIDLGRVGDVEKVNPDLLFLLLQNNFLPVIACLGTDNDGKTYNINADMMAGAIAGRLEADYFILTNVNGLYKDIQDPESKIDHLVLADIPQYSSFFQGGMIPKIESCKIALEKGAKSACILNGTRPELIQTALTHPNKNIGTQILK